MTHSNIVNMRPLFGLPISAEGLDSVVIKAVPKDQILFEQGDVSDTLYLIICGQIALFTPENDKVVEVLEPGSYFGEESLFDGKRLFSAKALKACRVTALNPQKITPLHELMRLALQSVSERQGRLIADISALKSTPPLQRLAKLIYNLPEVALGQTAIKLPWRKKIIAERIGIRHETFSRLLPGLLEHGIRIEGEWIHVENLKSLTHFVTGSPVQWGLRKPASRGMN